MEMIPQILLILKKGFVSFIQSALILGCNRTLIFICEIHPITEKHSKAQQKESWKFKFVVYKVRAAKTF